MWNQCLRILFVVLGIVIFICPRAIQNAEWVRKVNKATKNMKRITFQIKNDE